MSGPVVHSEAWTGPPERGSFVYPPRRSQDWAALRETARQNATPEQKRVAVLTALALLSPLFLYLSWAFAQAASPDVLWNDQREWLKLCAFVTIGMAVVPFRNSLQERFALRTALLVPCLTASAALGLWYPYAVIHASRTAVQSRPERTFELKLPRSGSGHGFYFLHQRADGSTLEGPFAGPALAYAPTCALVQVRRGEHGLTWLRVLERSPPAKNEVDWPIKREDCFSAKPLSALVR